MKIAACSLQFAFRISVECMPRSAFAEWSPLRFVTPQPQWQGFLSPQRNEEIWTFLRFFVSYSRLNSLFYLISVMLVTVPDSNELNSFLRFFCLLAFNCWHYIVFEMFCCLHFVLTHLWRNIFLATNFFFYWPVWISALKILLSNKIYQNLCHPTSNSLDTNFCYRQQLHISFSR